MLGILIKRELKYNYSNFCTFINEGDTLFPMRKVFDLYNLPIFLYTT